jgi:hypothetical protein
MSFVRAMKLIFAEVCTHTCMYVFLYTRKYARIQRGLHRGSVYLFEELAENALIILGVRGVRAKRVAIDLGGVKVRTAIL